MLAPIYHAQIVPALKIRLMVVVNSIVGEAQRRSRISLHRAPRFTSAIDTAEVPVKHNVAEYRVQQSVYYPKQLVRGELENQCFKQ